MHPLQGINVALLETVPDVDRVDLMANAELFQVVVALVEASESAFYDFTLLAVNSLVGNASTNSRIKSSGNSLVAFRFGQICIPGFGGHRQTADACSFFGQYQRFVSSASDHRPRIFVH
jgi:hypothetical protein